MTDIRALIESRWREGRANPWFLRGAIISAAIVVVDQITKQLVLANEQLVPAVCSPQARQFCGRIELSSVMDFTMVWNTGISFGLLAGGPVARVGLTLFSFAIATALFYWLAGLQRRLAAVGVALVAGGALGNAYDRAAYGAVVDFFDFSGPWFGWVIGNWPVGFPWVFNVADAAINVGVAMLLLDAFFTRDEKPA